MKPYRRLAWAVDANRTFKFGGHGLLGRTWFANPLTESPYSVVSIATFQTRREARAAMREQPGIKTPRTDGWCAFPRARVVRVEIIVREVS